MEMFNRHNEITRSVEEIPGDMRTVTERARPISPRNFRRMCRGCTRGSGRVSR